MPESDPRPPDTSSRWKRWAVNIVLVVIIFSVVHWWKARPMVSGDAPALAGTAVDGTPIDLAAMLGAPVMVHFWASWCPLCKAMDGTVASIAEDYPVVTVAMQSGEPADIRRFLDDAGLDLDVLPDPYGKIAGRWGVPGVPATFVVDGAGAIRSSTVGFSTEPGLRARLWAADDRD